MPDHEHDEHQFADQSARDFWDSKYSEKDQIWSGKVNATLEKYVASLKPGKVLDLGCGEGGDAIWLAKNGWQVVATDISQVALDRAEKAADAQGLSDRVSLEQHDFAVSFPSGKFDLVSAHFLQSPIEFDRALILQKSATAVDIGGRLLIVEHGAAPPWSNHLHDKFPTAQETFDSLMLKSDEWKIEVLGSFQREGFSPAGEPAHLLDNVIMVERVK